MYPRFHGRLLDTIGASALLGCSPAALVRFRVERRGPPFVRVGRLIRYRRVDLARWVKSQRVSPMHTPRPDEARHDSNT
jgi:hypothetical protein